MVDYTIAKEYYDSVDDLFAEDDCLEVDLKVSNWSKSIRIRALSLAARERINKAAGVDDKRDWIIFVTQTLLEGVVRPKFNSANVQKAIEHNAEVIDAIVESIWQLGRIDKNIFDSYIKGLKELNDERSRNNGTPSTDREESPEQENTDVHLV